jgi:hypothetical protein
LKERDFDLLVEKKVQEAIEEVLAVQEGLSPQ